ncbi:MAG: sigma-54 dependent transcriptional regulator [Acidobacteriia bacterium]|nr:sigma-54 dependent transcriptional regulator [Terriglobia bacterium]
MSTHCNDSCAILVVDDDQELLTTLGDVLLSQKYRVKMASSAPEALAVLKQSNNSDSICLALIDLIMPLVDGLSLLEEIRSFRTDIPVLMMTGFGTIEIAVEAMKKGAEDFLIKPFEKDLLLKKIAQVLDLHRQREAARLQSPDATSGEAPQNFKTIIARSPRMRGVVDRARAAALSDLPVLLLGETGTGKEMLAREIHAAGKRSGGPFIPVNCGALPRDLVESELFGHQRGSFTGALSETIGLFRAADGGTILLDEIGDLPREAQVKLLRVLQEGEVRPIGGPSSVRVNVRTISASNSSLSSIRQEHLREDLFYRVSAITIELPPLRERREDIAPLLEHYLRLFNAKYGRTISLDPAVLDWCLSYSFPGNIRQLVNALESAMATAPPDRTALSVADLRAVADPTSEMTSASAGQRLPFSKTRLKPAPDVSLLSMESVEKFAIQQALHLSGNNKSRAAEILEISRDSLYRKLRQYGLDTDKREG